MARRAEVSNMAVNISIGRNSIITIDAASSETVPAIVSATTIGGVFTGSFTRTTNTIPSDHNDAAGYTSKEIGNTSASLSFTCRYSPGDAGQLEAEAAANGATKVKKTFQVLVNGTGGPQWIFNGIITSCVLNPGANEDTVNMDITIESSGAITFSDP